MSDTSTGHLPRDAAWRSDYEVSDYEVSDTSTGHLPRGRRVEVDRIGCRLLTLSARPLTVPALGPNVHTEFHSSMPDSTRRGGAITRCPVTRCPWWGNYEVPNYEVPDTSITRCPITRCLTPRRRTPRPRRLDPDASTPTPRPRRLDPDQPSTAFHSSVRGSTRRDEANGLITRCPLRGV